jgi:arylsulfatase A-like enzyme
VLPVTLWGLLGLACALGPVRPHASPPPNVLLIISDDLRTELGCYGGAAITPHLDRLAAQGVRFDRAYCQYPLCNPSRTSLLTGRHPTTTGVYGNREWVGAAHPDWVSLPRHFRNNGYFTARAGKIFHGGIDDTDAWTVGGERRQYEAAPAGGAGPRRPTSAQQEAARLGAVSEQDRARAPASDRWEAAPEGSEPLGDTAAVDRTIALLRERRDARRPFFIACGLSKPHSPLVAPKRFFDAYQGRPIDLPIDFAPRPTVPPGFPAGSIRPINADLFIRRDAEPEEARDMIRAYRACVSYVDWNLGRLLAELDRLGLRGRTIVVFLGDHGYQLGEKGKWSKAGSLWEQGARIPLIIHDPRSRGNGRASPRIVQAVDLYPTLVDLCGLPRPKGLEGRSLRGLLDAPDAAWDRPAFTVWSERGRWLSGVAVRTERWRYAEFYGIGAGRMLTDPLADPHELTNLADDPRHAPVVRELSALVGRYAAGKTEPDALSPRSSSRGPEPRAGPPNARGRSGRDRVP